MTAQKIGLGTAALGRPEYINVKAANYCTHYDKEAIANTAFEVFAAAYEAGVRYFDTAPGYGIAEALLLKWIKATAKSDVLLGTKWGYTYEAALQKNAVLHEVKNHELQTLTKQWETSKLFDDQLKYYQIHSAGFDTNVFKDEKVLNQLAVLKADHDFKIGITTSGTQQKEVLEYAFDLKVNGIELFDSFQVTYNVLHQDLKTTISYLKSKNKTVILKEALANGRVFKNAAFSNYNAFYQLVQQLSTKYNVGVDAIAIRFVLDTVDVNYVLSGAATIQQLKANLKALNFTLGSDEIAQLSSIKNTADFYWNERKQLPWH